MKKIKNIIGSYKAEVTKKKKFDIPMPKFRAGQEILINAKEYFSDNSERVKENFFNDSIVAPISLLIKKARFVFEDTNEWVYYTELDSFLESYIIKNLIK